MYEYAGHVFEIRPCFGGVSATIWCGRQTDQCEELGLWTDLDEAILACVAWIDQKKAAKMNDRAKKGGVDSKKWTHS